MQAAIFVLLASCMHFASAQVCPTFEYGEHAFGTDCTGGTPCTLDSECGITGEKCCEAGCTNGAKFCIEADFPNCPPDTAIEIQCTTSACDDSPCNKQFGATCTNICLNCFTHYTDAWNNVIPRENCKCPDGVPIANDCSANCGTCEANPTAQCRVDRCGTECVVKYYDQNMNIVACEGPCSSFPCQNGGTCEEDGDSFTCDCTSDYTGTTCQNKKKSRLSSILRILLLSQLFSSRSAPTLAPSLPPALNPCPPGKVLVPNCPQSLCATLTCPLRPAGTVCRIDPCGTCTYSFYDTVTGQKATCF